MSAAATSVIAVANTARAPTRSVRPPTSGLASAMASSSGPPTAAKAVRLQPISATTGFRKTAKT